MLNIVNATDPLANLQKHGIVACFPVNNKGTGGWITLIQPMPMAYHESKVIKSNAKGTTGSFFPHFF